MSIASGAHRFLLILVFLLLFFFFATKLRVSTGLQGFKIDATCSVYNVVDGIPLTVFLLEGLG